MSQNHSQTPDYPLRWEADVVLRDGSLAHVRPITPNDTERIHRFHAGQSERSIYMRFFAPIKKLSDETVHTFTHVDHDQRAALVALTGDNIIGIARYDRLHDPRTAEVAFNIADSCQGKGVGSVLLEHLAVIAHEKGIERFIAEVLPTNRQMLAVFTDAGYEITRAFEEGIITVEFTIETTEKTANVQLAREHHAEASSMARILRPHGIAIIGASRRPHATGTTILDNLLDGGYTGPIHVISTEATTLRGLPVYRTARDIPQPADLAIIAVPPPTILTVLDDCAAAGIKAACIIGTGYAESGPEGEHLQNQLLRHARRLGLRIVGPASAGIANHDPTISLDATVTTIPTTPGHIGIFAQSGGVASALLSTLSHRKLGLSTLCSAGNRIDVSGNDFMQFLIDDDTTHVAGLYLESVGNARKFSRIARQLSLRKPIVCVKTDTQHTIPTGHRARATTLPPQAFNTMLNQAGVIHAASVHELANTCELLAGQPLPASNHVALISNSPGILAILHNDAHTAGLTPTHTTPLPLNSPVEDIAAAIHTAATTPNVDAILIALAPPLHDSEETVAAAISHTQWAHHTPIAATFIGMRDVRDTMHRCSHHTPNNRRRTIPTYPTPAEAATAMGHAATYATWLATEHSSRVNPDNIDRTAASTLVNNLLTSHPNGITLTDTQTHQLLNTIGIHPWPLLEATTPHTARTAAGQLGYPVVLRTRPTPTHPTPLVRRDIYNDETLHHAHHTLREHTTPDTPIAIQQLAQPGTPLTLQTREDPVFGPIISLAPANPAAQLLGDIVYRIPPLTTRDTTSMLTELRSAPLLTHPNNTTGTDALADLIARISVLADFLPEIAHLTLDPINLRPDGIDVLGAHIHITPPATRSDPGRRTLT